MKKFHLAIFFVTVSFLIAWTAGIAVSAEPTSSVQALLDSYKKAAVITSFSVDDGKKLFTSKRIHSEKKDERSCTTCHTLDPRQKGKTPVGKVIEPMARSVNAQRFTDPKKIEKWFGRNCSWVLERECTPKEKGDYIAYMTSL